jgi:cell wall-associated NlpC family hydrolase
MTTIHDLPVGEQRALVIAEAVTWLRTPYHHAARVKGAGVDCAQILIAVYAAVGLIADFKPDDYPPDWMLHRSDERYLGHVMQYARQVDAPGPGDIAMWKFGRCFSHGAIVLEWPLVIHAYRPDQMVGYGDGTQGDLAGREVTYWSFWEG